MLQLNLNPSESQNIVIKLDSITVLPGSSVNAAYNIPTEYQDLFFKYEYAFKNKVEENNNYITNTKIISTYDDVIEHFKHQNDITDSKFTTIEKYFKKSDVLKFDTTNAKINLSTYVGDGAGNNIPVEVDYTNNDLIRLGQKFIIPGLDISAMILAEGANPEYVLYLDTENPIKYVDLDNNLSIFEYMRSNTVDEVTTNLIAFEGLIEEPKIYSDVFIDRGLNSGFEKVKKLKNIKNIDSLVKTGLGFYKINKKGFNFKDK
jgi:hypothetical protein